MSDIDHEALAVTALGRAFDEGTDHDEAVRWAAVGQAHATLALRQAVRDELRTIALLMGNQLLPDAHDAHLVGKRAMERMGLPLPAPEVPR